MSLRYATLGLLAKSPGSGYDLLRRFERSRANVWPATQSQLYGELNKLASLGLIRVTSTGARGRKEYAISDRGRADLRDWIDRDEHGPGRDAELVKVFSLGEVEPAAARAYFTAREERSAAELGHLQRVAEQVPWDGGGDADVFARIALEFGLRYREMVREWAAWASEQIPE